MAKIVLNKDVEVKNLGGGVSRKVLAHSEEIMAVEVTFQEGAVGAVHQHVHEQNTYVLSGEFLFSCDNGDVLVHQGDSLCFEPNEKHGTVCRKAGVLLDVFTPARQDFL